MDSSNSGSFQSSSGGAGGGAGDNDESISSFFNPSPNFNQILHPPPPQPHHHSTTFYNPSPPHFLPKPNPVQDPGSAWTGPIQLQLDGPDRNQPQPDFGTTYNNPITKPVGRGSDHQIGVTMKNPKKRTRASRRAPTTVLTTDTTNFRQMVQEFTGIPAAPFTTSPFSRRLDLFSRPSVQQQQPPFLNSAANIVESGTSIIATAATTSGNFNFTPSSMNQLQKQPSSFFDLQNPMFSFLQNSVPQHGFQTSLKMWSEENEKVGSFEGVIGNNDGNIGGSKFDSADNVMVSSISGADQVQANEGSWSCPSN